MDVIPSLLEKTGSCLISPVSGSQSSGVPVCHPEMAISLDHVTTAIGQKIDFHSRQGAVRIPYRSIGSEIFSNFQLFQQISSYFVFRIGPGGINYREAAAPIDPSLAVGYGLQLSPAG